MSISFSGLASGLDTSSWVQSLVALKQAKVTTLQKEKEQLLVSKDTLNSIKTFFSSFRSTIEKITDSKFNIVTMDMFAQNLATSANLSVLTATATTDAEEATYNIKVDKLATNTKAVSTYKTTVQKTTTANAESLLKNIGVTAGDITVKVDGIKHTVSITENETMTSFIDKLKAVGVEASYNSATGLFTMNANLDDIDDVGGTGILTKLNLESVNEGYKTVDKLEIIAVESEWDFATNDTKLSELGVLAGTMVIGANGAEYDVTVDANTKISELVDALRANNIDANFDEATGIFSLSDATIVNEGTTNIIDAMKLSTDIYSVSQKTGALLHETIVTQTTTATSGTLLKDIGTGTAIADGQTVIVKNSNNELTTIAVGTGTTVGDLLSAMTNAGLYAEIDSNGIIEISGGSIVGGTFDAVGALGLETEPFTAMTTGDPLTETIIEYELVTYDTRLVDDLGVTEGYLAVEDPNGVTYYQKIYSGQTIGDLMADLANNGIYSTLDMDTGILEITGGAFTTLTDADVQALVANNTIAETDARYQKGTNLLECLYGAGTISTNQITVASAYSRTQVLTKHITTVVDATLATTLGTLGLAANGTAIFDARGESKTVNVTTDMTVQGLMDALAAQGIESSWDSDFARITINNSTLTGGSSNLADVLNLTTELTGKYVTSDALHSETTITIDATRETTFDELGVSTNQSVVLVREDGTNYTFNVTGTTTMGDFLDTLNANGVTAKLEDGVFSIEGGYIVNDPIEEALGLVNTVFGFSQVLGNHIQHTIITTVTSDSTLGDIITALGTGSEVASGYNLSFNSTALNVNANTTLDNLMMQIYDLGGTSLLDTAGRLHIDGGTLSGTVANALGFLSVSTTASVAASGEVLATITTVNADTSTKLSALGLGASTIAVSGVDGVAVGTITTHADMTIGDILTALAGYGISGTMKDGVISLDSDIGNYATGGVLTDFGIGTSTSTYTTTAGTTGTSSAAITYNTTTYETTFPTLTRTLITTSTVITTDPVIGSQVITIKDSITVTEPVIGTQTLLITHKHVCTEPVIGSQTILVTSQVVWTSVITKLTTIEQTCTTNIVQNLSTVLETSVQTIIDTTTTAYVTATIGKTLTSSAPVSCLVVSTTVTQTSTSVNIDNTNCDNVFLRDCTYWNYNGDVLGEFGVLHVVAYPQYGGMKVLGTITVIETTTVGELLDMMNQALQSDYSYTSEEFCLQDHWYGESDDVAITCNNSEIYIGMGMPPIFPTVTGGYQGLPKAIALGKWETTTDVTTPVSTTTVQMTSTTQLKNVVNSSGVQAFSYYYGTLKICNSADGVCIKTITVNSSSTINGINNLLGSFGTASVANGKVSFTPTDGYFFLYYDSGGNPYKLSDYNGYTTTVSESVTGSFDTITLTGSTTFSYDFTTTVSMTFSVVVNEVSGTKDITTPVVGTITVDDVTTTVVTHQSVTTTVVEKTSTTVKTYDVEQVITVENTSTKPVTITVYGTAVYSTTTVTVTPTTSTYTADETSKLSQLGLTATGYVTVVSGGTQYTVTINTNDTVGDMIASLAGLGIYGSMQDGKVTFSGDSEAYIKGISAALATALKLNTSYYTTVGHTVTSNTSSSQQKETITASASGTTQLQFLRHSDGTAVPGYQFILSTTSDAGNQFTTIVFNATDTIHTVIDKLAEYGINASIDYNGRFSVHSSSLTDFSISGTLGTFMMGSYIKRYDEGQIDSVSTNLIQRTIVDMDNDTLLSKINITSGNILLYKDGTVHTLAIDNSKTVGDFRSQLAEYGITSDIIDGKLQLHGDGVVYLSTPATGNSNLVTILGLDHANWDLGDYSQISKNLTDTQTILHSATMDDKLNELTDDAGNDLGVTAGQIYVYQDGTRNILNINTNDTLQDLANKLSQYGIAMDISSDGKVYLDGNNNSYLTTDGIASGSASNILTKFNILNNWTDRFNSTSETLDYEVESDVLADGDTKLSDLQDASGNNLGITEGNYYVYQNGVRNTEEITGDTTLNDLRATMAIYGMTTDFNQDGSMHVGGYNQTYLATSNTGGYDTNAIAVLFEQWDFVNIYTSNNLEIPQDVIISMHEGTKLADINEGTYQAGYITVVKDGVKTDIELTADDTVGDLMDELALYGFESVINANGQLIIKNTGNSLLQAYVGANTASNALELLGIELNNWIQTNSYESGTVKVTTTTPEMISSDRATLLSEMGVTVGEFYIWKDGVKYTSYISTDETLGSLIEKLESFGLEASLVDTGAGSILSIEGSNNCYIEESASVNKSNVVTQLFTEPTSQNYRYTGVERVTTLCAATEDTLLSYYDDVANGLKAEGELSVTIDGVTNVLQIGADDTIGSLLSKFNMLGLDATLTSEGHIIVQSGYKELLINTAGTTSNVLDTLNIQFVDDLGGFAASNAEVQQTTTEDLVLSVSNYADYGTKMGLLNISDGSLTIYRDGEKATLNIDSNQTFADLRAQISGSFADVDIKFQDGYLTFFSTSAGVEVEVGATTDTSNFSAVTGITAAGDGTVKSARELYCVNGETVLTTTGLFRLGDIKAGTFTIGDAEFTIENTTTLADVIAQINASETSNATAYWDSIDGKLVIKSRTTGAALVNVEAGTSNFTDVMGLTKSEWASPGAIGTQQADVTKMIVDAQEVGDNARFSINGTYYTSASNTVDSAVSRIKGVTINLKGISTEGETTLTIERDKESVANAVSDIVDAYNALIENVDKEIAKDGQLNDQFALKLLRNQIRTLMTSSIGIAGPFRNLHSIGISLDDATAGDVTTDKINVLTFDKDKFIKAFDSDRDALKDLLVGTDANKGVFWQIENALEQALTASAGYFASAEKSYNTQITRLNNKIKKENQAVERYRERLEAKFASMDLLISNMQNQYSSFLGM